MTLTYAGRMTDDRVGRWPAAGRLAVDVVMFTKRDGDLAVLAVERAKEPFVAALALPGGFVEPGERAPAAAVRELAEETGIAISRNRLRRLACYQAPGRDPRGRVVSVAFHGYVPGAPTVMGGSDARTARWVDVCDFLAPGTLVAFDHRDIVTDAVARRFGSRAGTSVRLGHALSYTQTTIPSLSDAF
jgi:8-oxo-dGTP diphosphatase